eukprot:263087-Prorocentrum_minimum.AAC.1
MPGKALGSGIGLGTPTSCRISTKTRARFLCLRWIPEWVPSMPVPHPRLMKLWPKGSMLWPLTHFSTPLRQGWGIPRLKQRAAQKTLAGNSRAATDGKADTQERAPRALRESTLAFWCGVSL